jgi:hypothetical protein
MSASDLALASQTKALSPVMDLPTISVFRAGAAVALAIRSSL